MKKRTSIISIAVAAALLAAAGTGYALFGQEQQSYEVPILIDNSFSIQTSATVDKMKLVADKIYAETDDRDEAYLTVLNYAAQLIKYKASEDDQNILHDMILNGADPKRVTQIYVFLQDTCYGVELAEMMYQAGLEFTGDYWVEDAFNIVTEERHGVLSPEEVRVYLDNGLTAEDILTANVLCRKGIHTIQEILQMVQEGKNWEQIFSEAYQQEIKPKASLFGLIREEAAPAELLRAVKLSEVTDVEASAFLAEQADVVLEENEVYVSNKLLANAEAYLERIGVVSDAKAEPAVNPEIISRAVAHGVTQTQVDTYLATGYSDLDILNAAALAEARHMPLEKALVQMEEDMEGGAAQ